jgi:hypothetical protein
VDGCEPQVHLFAVADQTYYQPVSGVSNLRDATGKFRDHGIVLQGAFSDLLQGL